MNTSVDLYFTSAKRWQKEMLLLRRILLDCQLEECLKWGKPCYSYQNKNIVIIQSFKEHCNLGFFNGASLKDPNKLLLKAGEHSQGGRQLRFKDSKDIINSKAVIRSYIKQSIELNESNVKLKPTERVDEIIVTELQDVLKKTPAFKKAFESLTPGRQRGYLIYFSGAKQSETRAARIKNYTTKIMCGKGLNDCTCGLSKRMPNCDGSHKFKK